MINICWNTLIICHTSYFQIPLLNTFASDLYNHLELIVNFIKDATYVFNSEVESYHRKIEVSVHYLTQIFNICNKYGFVFYVLMGVYFIFASS